MKISRLWRKSAENEVIRAVVATHKMWHIDPSFSCTYESDREGTQYKMGVLSGAYSVAIALGLEDEVDRILKSESITSD